MEKQLSAKPVLRRAEVEIRIAPDGSLVIPWFSPESGDLTAALWESLHPNREPFPVTRISNARIYCG